MARHCCKWHPLYSDSHIDPVQRDVHVHRGLAHGRRRPVRPGEHGLLHRRHRRVADRQGGPLVHPGRHALQLRRAERLHRELLDVRPRRRLPGRQGGDGPRHGQGLGLGPDVRLRPDRADQRGVGRPLPGPAVEFAAPPLPGPLHRQRAAGGGRRRPGGRALFLPDQRPRHPRVEREGTQDHVGDDR